MAAGDLRTLALGLGVFRFWQVPTAGPVSTPAIIFTADVREFAFPAETRQWVFTFDDPGESGMASFAKTTTEKFWIRINFPDGSLPPDTTLGSMSAVVTNVGTGQDVTTDILASGTATVIDDTNADLFVQAAGDAGDICKIRCRAVPTPYTPAGEVDFDIVLYITE